MPTTNQLTKTLQRIAWRALAVALLAAICLTTAPSIFRWQRTRVAHSLAEQALRFEDGRSEIAIDRLVELGSPAIDSLVMLASSGGPVAAPTARRVMSRELDAWELAADDGHPQVFAERAAELVDALGRNAEQFERGALRWAQGISRRIVRRSDLMPDAQEFAVLADCDRILSRPNAQESPRQFTAAWLQEMAPLGSPSAALNVTAEQLVDSTVDDAKTQASAPLSAASPLPSVQESPIANSSPAEMWILPQEQPAEPYSEAAERIGDPSSVLNTPLADAFALGEVLLDVPGPDEVVRQLHAYRKRSDRELVRELESARFFEAHAIRRVLEERGITSHELELIRELHSQVPEERPASLDRLSSLPPAAARRLLRWFVADEDAATRLRALTLLATSGDPALAEVARERAIRDADPRVAELAQRLVREQR